MAAAQELIWRVKVEDRNSRATLAAVRSEVAQAESATKKAGQSELSMRQQLAAASSLQRQRSAALVAEWKRTETAASNLAKGIQPVGANLQKITDIMQAMGSSTAALQGPMGGVASRIRSLGAVANEAGGGLGLLGVGIAGLIVAGAAAIKIIFDITRATAEWQGQFLDLSQQTGVNVETLSALDIVAKTTGSNIEQITASLGIFQKNLEEAQDPTSKQAKLLKVLGIETNNTEEAFRQTLKVLASMPEGFRQTATALELFGRGGKSVLAILKEMGGDLDGATERFRKMGILVTTDVATAADKFNDQLTTLGLQIRGITALIGNEAMPEINKAIASFSQYVTDNREVIGGWVHDIADAARGATEFGRAIIWLNEQVLGLGGLDVPIPEILKWIVRANNIVTGFGGASEFLKSLGQQGAGPANVTPEGEFVSPGSTVPADLPRVPGKPTKTGKGKTSRAARDTSLQDSLKEAALAERELRLQIDADVEENKRAFEREARTIEEFTKRAIELADQRLNAVIDHVNAEQAALDEAFQKKLIKQKEHETRTRELTIETKEAVQKNEEEISKLEDDRDKKIAAAQIAARERLARMIEEADQRIIGSIQDQVKQGTLLESEAGKQIAKIVADGYQRRKETLEEELKAYGVTLERREEINDELIRLDGERAGAAVEASHKIRDALKEENEEREKNAREAFGVGRPRRISDATRTNRRATIAPDISAIDQLFEHVNKNLVGANKTAALAGLEALTTAFSGLGEAVGQAAYAWVLYGNAGTSVQKVTAEILASIAQQSAVKAIFEFAEGLAALALAWMGWPNAGPSAAEHFAASAAYAAIGGVAAIAGRAIAGNRFANDKGGSGGGGGGSSTRGTSTNTNPTPINLGSQRQQQIAVHITFENTPGKMFQTEIKNVVVRDIGSGNGSIRQAVIKEIKRQE